MYHLSTLRSNKSEDASTASRVSSSRMNGPNSFKLVECYVRTQSLKDLTFNLLLSNEWLVKPQVRKKEYVKGGGGVLGSSFAGYVPLPSHNPYPIIV